MKLIIDIPETMIQELKDGCFGVKHNVYELAGCIMNGTPLEDIKTEIEEQVLESLSDGGDDWFTAEKVNECLDIIDKHIGK